MHDGEATCLASILTEVKVIEHILVGSSLVGANLDKISRRSALANADIHTEDLVAPAGILSHGPEGEGAAQVYNGRNQPVVGCNRHATACGFIIDVAGRGNNTHAAVSGHLTGRETFVVVVLPVVAVTVVVNESELGKLACIFKVPHQGSIGIGGDSGASIVQHAHCMRRNAMGARCSHAADCVSVSLSGCPLQGIGLH